MRKVSKTEIRRIKVIDILINGMTYHYYKIIHPPHAVINNPFTATTLLEEALNSYSEALSQQDIIKIRCDYFRNIKDRDLEKKISLEVSKTLRSLEEDKIITRTPIKIPGTKGPAQNMVSLKKDKDTLYKILKEYNNPLVECLHFFKTPLLTHSKYYKNLVNIDLINDLSSLLGFPLTDKDKKKLYYLVTTSSRALYKLFIMAYEGKPKPPLSKDSITLNDKKHWFYQNIELDFLNDYYKNFLGHEYNIKADIKIKFENEKIYEVFNFSENEKMFYVVNRGDCDEKTH